MKGNKILLVNNTIFYEEGDALYLNKETGNFFVQMGKQGYAISVFQISQIKTSKDSFANFNIKGHGLKVYDVKRRKNRILPFIKAFFKIINIVNKNDFIYLFYPGPICQVIALICFLFNKPYGIYLRGEQGINSFISKFLLKKAKFVLTISPEFTVKVSEFNPKSYTIRPMIGFSEKDIIKDKKIHFKEVVNLLYVGRIVFDKGLFELIDALKILIEKGYSIFLNLVGGGTDLEKLKNYVGKKSLTAHVKFHGMISDQLNLKNIYSENDLIILPSYHEGFPRVLYEGMIMHMPIITTFVGSIGFLMKDKENSIEIKPQNVQSIVDGLELVLKDESLAQSISDEGTNTIIKYLVDKKLDHSLQLDSLLKNI